MDDVTKTIIFVEVINVASPSRSVLPYVFILNRRSLQPVLFSRPFQRKIIYHKYSRLIAEKILLDCHNQIIIFIRGIKNFVSCARRIRTKCDSK